MKGGEFKFGPSSKEEFKKDMLELFIETLPYWGTVLVVTLILLFRSSVFAASDTNKPYKESYGQWWESNKENKTRRLGVIETDKCNEKVSADNFSICTKDVENIRVRFQIRCLDKKDINDQYFLSNRIVSWKYAGLKGKVRTDEFGTFSLRISLEKNQSDIIIFWNDVIKASKVLKGPYQVLATQPECKVSK